MSEPAEYDRGTCIHCGKCVSYNPRRGWEHANYLRFCDGDKTKGEVAPVRRAGASPGGAS